MKIALHPKLYNNAKILSALESEFGGITQDTPDFIENDFDINTIEIRDCDNEIESQKYFVAVYEFLDENFRNEVIEIVG
jgi:hypothetical protein